MAKPEIFLFRYCSKRGYLGGRPLDSPVRGVPSQTWASGLRSVYG